MQKVSCWAVSRGKPTRYTIVIAIIGNAILNVFIPSAFNNILKTISCNLIPLPTIEVLKWITEEIS
ncbi:hypothetical protein [Mucilaginibacter straminoryzae]|nr:hypothetical protein [Mucilaginibacter straminoryzae]